jgi:hypothetical protein
MLMFKVLVLQTLYTLSDDQTYAKRRRPTYPTSNETVAAWKMPVLSTALSSLAT